MGKIMERRQILKKNQIEWIKRNDKAILYGVIIILASILFYKLGYNQAVTDMAPHNPLFNGGFWNAIRSVGYKAALIFAIIMFGIGQIFRL